MGVLVQIFATIIACFPCFNMGILGSLPSSTIANFKSLNTTLNRPMTEMEGSLFGSLVSAGALVGTPIVAFILDRLGRKYCTVLAGLAGVLSWTIMASSALVEMVLVAIFIGGVGGMSFLIVPAYCSEFCQESIRGTMAAGSIVSYGMGTLVSYLLGAYLNYEILVYVALAMSVVQLVLMGWLKESPTVLLRRGSEEQAARAIAFYRQVEVDSKLVMQELLSIRRSLNPEESQLVPEKDCEKEEETKMAINDTYKDTVTKKQSLWQYFKTTPAAQRGFFITLILMSATIFQGLIIVQVYAEPIFKDAVPSMTPTSCAISFAVAIVVASVVAAYLSDLAGRRPLIIYSSTACGVCCVLLGTQMQLLWAPGWVTAALIYMFAMAFSLGGGTVPFVMVAEVFVPEVKSIMGMIVVEWMWFCYFLVLLIFYPLLDLLGLGGVFHFFGGMCFLTAIFSGFYVPETKGLTLDEVQLMLAEKRNH